MSVVRYRKPEVLASIPKDRHAVIEASAGTGKTYTLEHLVVELILSGVEISKILVVTFTKPATSELVGRIRGLLIKLLDLDEEERAPADVPDAACWILDETARARIELALRRFDAATISTIHSFCQGILTEHAFANQRLFSEKIVDGDEAFLAALRETIRDEIAPHPERARLLSRWLEEKGLGRLEELFAKCRRGHGKILPRWEDGGGGDGGGADRTTRMLAAIGDEISLEALVVQEFMPLIEARLRAQKRRAGLYDYDDMLSLVQGSLRGAHGEALISLLRDRYSHALIDEFQDTDELQWEIFRTIFFDSDRKDEAGRPRNLMYLIGDPKQAIYRFRGADVETYLGAKDTILSGGGARVALRHNYRSTSALIDGYNEILRQDPQAPFFTRAGIDYAEPVLCGDEALALVGPEGRPAPPLHLFEMKLPKGKRGDVRSQEAILPPLGRAIARHIRAITSKASPSLRMKRKGGEEKISFRDVYILCNTNAETLRIGAVLREEGVPFAYFKQDGLFQTEEARALLELLRAVADPADETRRMQAWLSPFFGLKLRELEDARRLPPSHPLYQRLFDWKAEADGRSFSRLFSRIFDESGIVRRLILSEKGERALTNYLHLAELLLEAQGKARRSLPELIALFSRWVAGDLEEGREGNQQRLESDRDAVQIMTMHASKGLEAKVVFLVSGLNKNNQVATRTFHDESGERVTFVWRAPSGLKKRTKLHELTTRAGEAAAQEESWEAQRLLYVALTRAKARLYLPFYTSDPASKPLTSAYGVVDDRLRLLLAQGRLDDHCSSEVVDCAAAADPAPTVAGAALAGWEPAVDALEIVDHSEHLARLRTAHRGYRVTSYTEMKSGGAPPPPHDPDREDFMGETQGSSFVSPAELPGGAGTGIFLHEVLALVPEALVLGAADAAAFAAHPEIDAILRDEAAKAGMELVHLPKAAELIFTALRAKVRLHGGETLDGIAAAQRLLREMEFLYPIPEDSHPRLTEAFDGSALEVRRGFIKGFVDVLFEQDGRAYFGDWKSDVLPNYSEAEMKHRVEQSYRLQAKLYCLALVKMLELRGEAAYERRFGGFLYLFLRGMQQGGDGSQAIYFERPSWEEILSWEAELVEDGRRKLGGAA